MMWGLHCSTFTFLPLACYIYLTCPKNLACRLVLARPTDLGRELKENQKRPRIDTKVPPSSLLTGEAEMIALGRTATLGLFFVQ